MGINNKHPFALEDMGVPIQMLWVCENHYFISLAGRSLQFNERNRKFQQTMLSDGRINLSQEFQKSPVGEMMSDLNLKKVCRTTTTKNTVSSAQYNTMRYLFSDISHCNFL